MKSVLNLNLLVDRWTSWRGEGAEDLTENQETRLHDYGGARIFSGSFGVQSLEIITDGLRFKKVST